MLLRHSYHAFTLSSPLYKSLTESDFKQASAALNPLRGAAKLPAGFAGEPWAGGYRRLWRCHVSFVVDRGGHLAANG